MHPVPKIPAIPHGQEDRRYIREAEEGIPVEHDDRIMCPDAPEGFDRTLIPEVLDEVHATVNQQHAEGECPGAKE